RCPRVEIGGQSGSEVECDEEATNSSQHISTRRRVEPHCGYSTALLRVGSGANHRQRHRNTGVVIGSPQNSLGRGFSKYWARV
ncbi:unnamed protein product, partial [Pylaiella littoralis]